MLRSRLLVAILLLSAFLFSCSGEDGATGPAGPKGADGADGNANVTAYEFGTRTTTTGTINYQFTATQAHIDSCLVLGYFQSPAAAGNWYPIPGVGPNTLYQTRSYWQATNATTQQYVVKLVTMDGTTAYLTSTTFSKMKLYLVPASVIIPLTSRGLLNVSDYNAVRDYLKLSD